MPRREHDDDGIQSAPGVPLLGFFDLPNVQSGQLRSDMRSVRRPASLRHVRIVISSPLLLLS